MTEEQFDALVKKQNGQCAVCGVKPKLLFIDHDHACCNGVYSCGKCIRGLLCSNCNSALGLVHEKESTLIRLIDYLHSNKRGIDNLIHG